MPTPPRRRAYANASANAWGLAALAAAITFSLTTTTSSAVAAEDGILKLTPNTTIKATGNQIKGVIHSETAVEVKIGSQTVPVEQIDSLEYDPMPPNYLLANNREKAGNLAEAADLFGKAATDAGSSKPFVARAAQFHRARIVATIALGEPNRAAEAVNLLEAFLRANANARQTGPALELLARLHISKSDVDKADKALDDLAKIPWAQSRARVMQAQLLITIKKYDEAITNLDGLIAAAAEGSESRRDATLAKAEALGGLKRFDEAEKLARGVIAAAGPEDAETQAAAHNALGEVLRQAGKPKEALVEFLHTDILYPRDREQHARALARIAGVCRELKLEDQAKDAVDRLKADYPTSPFASEVK